MQNGGSYAQNGPKPIILYLEQKFMRSILIGYIVRQFNQSFQQIKVLAESTTL